MNSFSFSTKAQTLNNLKQYPLQARIPPQYFFTIGEWKKRKTDISEHIKLTFKTAKKIIVRSSAVNEDTHDASMAGQYKSVLNVSLQSKKAIHDAIEAVKNSYSEKEHADNDHNEILIQPQLTRVTMSGVMFTKDVNSGTPYIIINYDDKTGSTESVTSGSGNALKVFHYYKYSKGLPLDERLVQLIELARSLEKITQNEALDIEFAFNPDGLHVLQVRPITTHKTTKSFPPEQWEIHLASMKNFFRSQNVRYPNLAGYKVVYGVMPDWNPAEIIGINPKPLSFSLYKELITDEIWPLSRKQIGYKDVGYHPGIMSFGGKPYIDVRLSFNTFLPASLSEPTADKLINFYLDKLIHQPELHDKVEFKVAYTAYDFNFERVQQELRDHLFTRLEIKEISETLHRLTDNIIAEKTVALDQEFALCHEMEERRKKIVSAPIPYEVKIAQLIYNTKQLGTLPFSKLARFAFFANILLKSLVEKGVLTLQEHDALFGSIETVAGEFLHDLFRLKKGQLSRDHFLETYGHLRPGTYEITSPNYAENFEHYIDLNHVPPYHEPKTFAFSQKVLKTIEQEIKKTGFSFSVQSFLNFIKKATYFREKSKFLFTKNIDLIFRYIEELLPDFSREELSFLNIKDIFGLPFHSKTDQWKAELKKTIEINQGQYEMTKAIKLPPIIYLEENFDFFHMKDDSPNYVTTKCIQADVVYVQEGFSGESDLTGKIVIIENADPGYDWIFSHNIRGLITKYGGVGSHMSIRAAEFQLPAAIGCGSYLFDLVKDAQKIELNCGARKIQKIF